MELSSGAGIPIARSTECSMDVVDSTEGFLQKGLTIGTGKIKAALRLNVNDP